MKRQLPSIYRQSDRQYNSFQIIRKAHVRVIVPNLCYKKIDGKIDGKLMEIDVLKLIIVYTHRPTGRVYCNMSKIMKPRAKLSLLKLCRGKRFLGEVKDRMCKQKSTAKTFFV